jgi:hypothetical protein
MLSKKINPLLPKEMLSQDAVNEILKVDPMYFGLDAKGVEQQRQNIRKNIPSNLGTSQITPMAQTPIPRSMPMNMPTMEEPQPEQDSTNFLGSLLAQGTAMLGAGIQGGDIAQVGRSFEAGRQRAEQDRKAKALVDPKSEESKRRRMVFQKAMGFDIPEEYSATDLNDPVVLQSIRDKKMQELAPKGGTGIGVRGGGGGGGVGQAKEEKRKDPTEAERLSLGFAKRTESSNKMLNNLEDKFLNKEGGFSPSSQFAYAPERFKSSERKNYEAAQKDFIGSVLRKESGASISDEEFNREAEKFFPLPGDTEENIRFKQLLRNQAINNLKTSANIKYVRDNQTGETVEIDPFGNVLRRYKE